MIPITSVILDARFDFDKINVLNFTYVLESGWFTGFENPRT